MLCRRTLAKSLFSVMCFKCFYLFTLSATRISLQILFVFEPQRKSNVSEMLGSVSVIAADSRRDKNVAAGEQLMALSCAVGHSRRPMMLHL